GGGGGVTTPPTTRPPLPSPPPSPPPTLVPDHPAVVRGTGIFERSTLTSGVATSQFQYGDPGDVVLLCDWDGDGHRTAGVFRAGVWFVRNGRDGGTADVAPFTFGNAGDRPVCGHWSGAGSADQPGVVRNGVFYLRSSLTSGVAD